jgi:hypothetical protein
VEQLLYSYRQAATLLGYRNTQIIQRLVAAGRLTPVYLCQPSRPRIRADELRALAASSEPPPEAQRPTPQQVAAFNAKLKSLTQTWTKKPKLG